MCGSAASSDLSLYSHRDIKWITGAAESQSELQQSPPIKIQVRTTLQEMRIYLRHKVTPDMEICNVFILMIMN